FTTGCVMLAAVPTRIILRSRKSTAERMLALRHYRIGAAISSVLGVGALTAAWLHHFHVVQHPFWGLLFAKLVRLGGLAGGGSSDLSLHGEQRLLWTSQPPVREWPRWTFRCLTGLAGVLRVAGSVMLLREERISGGFDELMQDDEGSLTV